MCYGMGFGCLHSIRIAGTCLNTLKNGRYLATTLENQNINLPEAISKAFWRPLSSLVHACRKWALFGSFISRREMAAVCISLFFEKYLVSNSFSTNFIKYFKNHKKFVCNTFLV